MVKAWFFGILNIHPHILIIMSTIDEKTLAENSDALCLAARNGDIDEVRRLIPISDPSVYNYQPLTWAVTYRYTDILRELIPVSKIDRKGALDTLLNQAAVNGDAKSLAVLLPYYASTLPSDVDINTIFTRTAEAGHVDCLAALLPFCDPKYKNSWALKSAGLYKKIDAIEFLIPLSDTQDVHANKMLLEVVNASQPYNSKSREVAVLLQLPYLTHNTTEALKIAAEKGDVEVLKLLISVSDPKDNNSEALLSAVKNNHVECVRCLIPVSDVDAMGSQALVQALYGNAIHRHHNTSFDNQIELMLLDGSDLDMVWQQVGTPEQWAAPYKSHAGESEEQRQQRLEQVEQDKIRAYPELYNAIVSRHQQKLLEQIALEAHAHKTLAVDQWRDNKDEHNIDHGVEVEDVDQPKQRKI